MCESPSQLIQIICWISVENECWVCSQSHSKWYSRVTFSALAFARMLWLPWVRVLLPTACVWCGVVPMSPSAWDDRTPEPCWDAVWFCFVSCEVDWYFQNESSSPDGKKNQIPPNHLTTWVVGVYWASSSASCDAKPIEVNGNLSPWYLQALDKAGRCWAVVVEEE